MRQPAEARAITKTGYPAHSTRLGAAGFSTPPQDQLWAAPGRAGGQARDTSALIAWMAFLGFSALTTLLLLLDMGHLVGALYPAGALLVAIFLYATRPTLFFSFAFWIWFLTPLVRRLVDYQTGWHTFSPVMIAPFLVSGVTIASLFRHGALLMRRELFPFALLLVACAYATAIGIAVTTLPAAAFGMLNWAVPILLAFDIARRAEDYPALSKTLMSTFALGALVMGGYGIIQYFYLPEWDSYWLGMVGMENQGKAFAQEVRVWSTLNSSGPFAFVMVGSLLALTVSGGLLRLPAVLAGYGGFFLSLVRAAWLGLIVGLLVLFWTAPGLSRLRLLGVALITAALVIPMVLWGPFGETVSKRMTTLTSLDEDVSFQERRSFYQDFLSVAVTSVVGAGIGATGTATKLTNDGRMEGFAYFDSGVMQIPFVLGWLGCGLYVFAIASLILWIASSPANKTDPFARASLATAISVLSLTVFENSLIGVEGSVFWAFLGLAVAARRHAEATASAPSPADLELVEAIPA